MRTEHQDPAKGPSGQGKEEGSALVIALLAVVVMTVLGLVLMDVLRGGMVQAVTTEGGIQAEAIAQKGLDDTLALLRGAVAQGEKGTDYRGRINLVDAKLAEAVVFLHDKPDVEAKKGTYHIELLSDETKMNPELSPVKPVTSPDFPYVRKFVIKSTGVIESKPEKRVTKQMTVYVSTINPVFRYPVSSGKDLTMNGTPYVTGDVLVRGDSFLVGDEAFFTGVRGSKYGLPTGLPALRGFLRVDGDGVAGGIQKYYSKLSDGTDASSDLLDPAYFTDQYFPLEDASLDNDVAVDAAAYVKDKAETKLNSRLSTGFGSTVTGLLDYTLYNSANASSVLYDGEWVTVQGNVTNGNGSADADLFVNSGVLMMDDENGSLTVKRGSIYIKSPDSNLVAADLRGKLNVDEDRFVAVDGNVTLNQGFDFPRGSMYIKGDLKIIGNIRLQGTVYVDGNVELKEMKSINKKLNAADEPIPLIIVASGEIVLGNNTNENNEEVRAFLYSKKNMTLYGVISKLNLLGGIHGESGVELNAVRGELSSAGLTPTVYAGPAWSGQTVQPGQQSMAADTSRLQIFYDNNLYDKPPYGIPITSQFNVFVKDIQYLK
ncbi:hypothetical protein [Paenibacillus cremeus]|uniref:Uncharacterized protein n=1 Tax=Paenibacillus cremeus TaxID=2163881 RepID=A0A559KE82_9BACL|nr:hypothetical protein [Paenibacillus cremeus]TVY10419.1 hypothetical protein FPZ49_08465 [Paenibacillus cremeus]